MNHIKALAIKFIASLVLLYLILGAIYGMSFGNVFLITLVLGLLSYIVGDLLILRRTNNMTATLADFGLALIVIWTMTANLTDGRNPFAISLISAIGVALFEVFFHRYISKFQTGEKAKGDIRTGKLRYQTEASEELAPNSEDYIRKKRDNNNSGI